MNLKEAFQELDSLYESTTFMDRDTLIAEIKNYGYNYKFEKYDDRQLYNIWHWAKKKAHANRIAKKINNDFEKDRNIKYCQDCGTQLMDNGECRICSDYGFEELDEWVDFNGNIVNTSKQSTAQQTKASSTNSKNRVIIIYDNTKHKLRAWADDGIHGGAWVAFPNNLRTSNGQQYEVDQLIWTGRNYRVSGDINPVYI